MLDVCADAVRALEFLQVLRAAYNFPNLAPVVTMSLVGSDRGLVRGAGM